MPVIIPSLQPNDKLIVLIENLKAKDIEKIIIVDDGSGEDYRDFFDRAAALGCTVLTHAVNLGKGRAMKTAFNYCLTAFKKGEIIGAVTADSDGQHSAEDIISCMNALAENPDALVLGARNFDEENVPFKSRYGNKITCFMMRSLCGINLGDTQTGLRAIPTALMSLLMKSAGERFEFETNMLIDCKQNGFRFVEVPIETIYEENHSTHFNPFRDAVKIYSIFFKFIFSSLSGAAVDLIMFAILTPFFFTFLPKLWYITAATVVARIISACVNYLNNHRVVFKSRASHASSTFKYVLVAAVQLALSAGLVTYLHSLLGGSEVVVKIVVDLVLFLVSFQIQREWVFK